MRYFALLLFTLSFFPTFSLCQHIVQSADGKTILLHENGSWTYADSMPVHKNTLPSIKNLEIPKTIGNEKIITHTGYTLVPRIKMLVG